MRKLLVPVLFTAFMYLPSGAQTATVPPLITVMGEATVKVSPDEIYITVGLDSEKDSPQEAKKDVDAKARRVINYLSQKLDPKSVTTDHLQLQQYMYGERSNTKRVYHAGQTISITLKNIAIYEEFMTGLMSSGIDRIDDISFRTSELRKFRDQARSMAIKAAREKADAMAKELGQSIGQAYSVEELTENSAVYRGRGARVGNQTAETSMAARPESDATVAPGQIPVTANILVSFYLK